MKKLTALILLLYACTAYSQQYEKYYDWKWKQTELSHARFISTVKKTDSGWLRTDYFSGTQKAQMTGLYKDSLVKIKNGYFKYFYSNGVTEMKGRFINNNKEGLWLNYHRNGMMSDSTLFQNNKPVGISISWHSNGFILDSTNHYSGVRVRWFDNGQPAEAGHIVDGKPHGKWQFFDKQGKLRSAEEYYIGKISSRVLYDKDGNEQSDTSQAQSHAVFKGGDQAWRRYLERNLTFPSDYKLVNGDIVTIVVSAVIDEEGNVTEPAVEIPFHPKFDEIGLALIKRSPKWAPAMEHNRPVKAIIRQPVSFAQ